CTGAGAPPPARTHAEPLLNARGWPQALAFLVGCAAKENLVESVGEAGVGQSRRDLQRVLIIDLPKHCIRKPNAVQLPERMVITVVIEVLVVGLEHTPVVRIFVRLIAVLPEQEPILVLDEEVVRRPWLTADVVQHR